jgi:ABC-2 type transport system permease protein
MKSESSVEFSAKQYLGISSLGVRYLGLWTLCQKEVGRFLSVSVQTIFAPLVSTLLYLLIFGQVLPLDAMTQNQQTIGYDVFLLPGLMMMAMLQNAFSNSSSSLMQSKMYGNFDLLLLSPLSAGEIYTAFIIGAVVRGLLVGGAIAIVALLWMPLNFAFVGWSLLFALLTTIVLGAMGFLAGLWSSKYDHLAAFQNFVILPLTFLSGVFYSVHALPEIWQAITWLNPFFYMVDGFRFGMLGVSDVSPWVDFAVTLAFAIVLTLFCVGLLKRGWKVRR